MFDTRVSDVINYFADVSTIWMLYVDTCNNCSIKFQAKISGVDSGD